MKPRRLAILLVLVVIASLFGAPSTAAQSGSGYDLTWNVIAGGGAVSAADRQVSTVRENISLQTNLFWSNYPEVRKHCVEKGATPMS